MQSVYLTLMLHSELEKSNGIIVGVSSIAGQSLCMRARVCVCVHALLPFHLREHSPVHCACVKSTKLVEKYMVAYVVHLPLTTCMGFVYLGLCV